MCVIAGYLGARPAAPILLEMLQRQEGFAGGYYSGIATLHEGRLHYAKVVGNIETLCSQTDALHLPGTIGIAHSRTPGGGGREWAHPFVDTSGQLAYIANGAIGKYENLPLLADASRELMASGHHFRSAQMEPVNSYPALDNGLSLHFSDFLCQAIADRYQHTAARATRLLDAGIWAYENFPGELVGLCLHAAHPDEIVALRHNKPLIFGRNTKDEIFAASTSIAFPAEVSWKMRMPPASGVRLSRNGTIEISPFTSPDLLRIGDFPSPETITRELLARLRDQSPASMETLFDAAAALYPKEVLSEKETIVFEALAALDAEGAIFFPTQERAPLDSCPVAPMTLAAFKP